MKIMGSKVTNIYTKQHMTQLQSDVGEVSEYSAGLQCLIFYLNSEVSSDFLKALAMTNKKLSDEGIVLFLSADF